MSKKKMKERMMALTMTNLRKILRGYNREFKIKGISTRSKEELVNEFVSKTDQIKTNFKTVIMELDDILSTQRSKK